MDQRSCRWVGVELVKQAPWLLAAEGELEIGRRVTLNPTEVRHAGGALRLRSGDHVVLADGVGSVASGTITLRGRGVAEVLVQEVDHLPPPTPSLALAVAVLAGAAMDLVAQKAVELGVERLTPVCCERSQMGLKRAMNRVEHRRRISRQALKQCRRAWAMELTPPTTLTDFANNPASAKGTVAHPAGDRIEEIPQNRVGLLLVGPEGGFSSDEERALDAAGWPRVCLGPHVLRAETAAIAGAAVFSSHLKGLHSTDV